MKTKKDIGGKFGFLGIDATRSNIKKDDEFFMHGYSNKEKQTNKHQMFKSPGKVIQIKQHFITYEEKTAGGQSGGPIVMYKNDQYYAVGVHIAGNHKQ